MSLRLKVLLVLFLVCLGAGYWGYRRLDEHIRPQFLRVMEDGMVDQAFLLAKMVEKNLPEKDPEKAIAGLSIKSIFSQASRQKFKAEIYESKKDTFDNRLYITDSKGIVRLDTDNGRGLGKDYSRWNDVYKALRGSYGARSTAERDSKGALVDSLYVAFPLRKQGKIVGVITLCKSKRSLVAWAILAQKKVWREILVGSMLLFLLFFFLSHLVLQPVFRLTQYARDIARGKRVEPPVVGGELGVLTQAFVEMKESLLQRQDLERFVTQLTHELKTPISAIQAAAELLEDPEMPVETRQRFFSNIQNQTQRMNDIVQRLLMLVTVEQQETLDKAEDIDLEDFLAVLLERFFPNAQQKEIQFEIKRSFDEQSTVYAERFLLEQAIVNLFQNSLDFTPLSGKITLEVMVENERVVCKIEDDGPGIPEYALPRVIERFYSLERPETGSKGTGLGLPFVRQVALLHGGDFLIRNGVERGVIAEIILPLKKRVNKIEDEE